MDLIAMLGVAFAFFLAHWLVGCVWNVYFHPLSKFPGPRAAASSLLWRFLHEVVYQSDITHALPKLHRKYGKIIRTGPNEIHLSDPAAYHEIYTGKVRWNKDEFLYHSLGENGSAFGSLSVEEAKPRKSTLAPPFSRRAVSSYNDLLKLHANRLCNVLKQNDKRHEACDLLYAFRSFSLDVISKIAFCESLNAIDHPGFKHPILVSFDDALPAFQAAKFFPWIYGQLHSFSPSTIDRLWHSTGSLLRFRDYLVDIVLDLQSNRKNEDKEPCLLHKLMDPSKHTAEPKLSADTLQGEAQTVISGGVESVAHTAVYAAVFVGQDRTIANRLRVELEQIWPDPVGNIPDLAQLEKLPFLTAVLKESLRLAPGIPTPLPRVVPRNGATIGGKFIPGGTVVGASAQMLHYSEDLFKDAHLFKPDRWLHQEAQELDYWLVPFSKGPRACVGLNLAWAKLYMELAAIFRRFDIELTLQSSLYGFDPLSLPGCNDADGSSTINRKTGDFVWRDCFLPYLTSTHPSAYFHAVEGYD
ncbi:hypothetical protein ASPVEDRAFT_891039 [Aspergillus versicolor CBS 583.65]|uniref:Cytochrome P450 n=1 Tax=Aspergillus versicolor CBS 583.65 TaxID=1036611 RepID=A0A1L9PQV0_ASPVE|nr:uncharacterized protein ASPVEDRAFT_891039 [Aspergillus versicolor CBS 583.65]OJJ03879.1 hypothetical protein ASPVEDRAFT_891039 [Aspergillus versicolor CBS 583.65]